jgi:hypothetical protein
MGTLSGFNNSFISNTAQHGGALFFMSKPASIFDTGSTLSNGSFISNMAQYGGALFLSSASMELSDNILKNNNQTLFISTDVTAFCFGNSFNYTESFSSPLVIIDSYGNLDIKMLPKIKVVHHQ